MTVRETILKVGIILSTGIGPTLVGLYLLSQWQQNAQPKQCDLAELRGFAEKGRTVEVRDCVPDYENGCAIYEEKSRRILLRYVPLREVGKPDGPVYALLQYDTSMQSYWVAEGLVLNRGENQGAAEAKSRETQPTREMLRVRTVRGLTGRLTPKNESLINNAKAGWRVTGDCVVIEENKTPQRWKGEMVIAVGWLTALAFACLFYLDPVLAWRRKRTSANNAPLAVRLTPLTPPAFDTVTKTPRSSVALQYRVLIYPLIPVFAVSALWSMFIWGGYSRGATPREAAMQDFRPTEGGATCLSLENAHIDLTQTVATYQYSEHFGNDDKVEYYVPLLDGPDDEAPIRAFLHIAPRSEMRDIARDFERTREDGQAAQACAEKHAAKLEQRCRVMGRTDWYPLLSQKTRGQLALQFEGHVDPDFVIIEDGTGNELWVSLAWTGPALLSGLALGWLVMQVRKLENPTKGADRPGPKPPLTSRLPQ